jgi:uncharacterized caspase-like protein
MDKLLEQILKYVPPDIVPAILALVVAFFGTYYFRGLRSYTDALNDRVFLTLAVLIAGAFLVLQIQKSDTPRLVSNVRPLLLVPRFENDVGRELEALFVTQLRAAIERSVKNASIEQINTFVRDIETARLTAADVKPFAVLVQPKIIREGGNKPLFCFSLFFLETGTVTTFSAVPTELEKLNLSDLSNALVTASPQVAPPPGDPIYSRLDALERRVTELSNAIVNMSATVHSARNYSAKRAVVIGVNRDEAGLLPQLAFAVSDAQAMASALQALGFETTLIVNADATRIHILEAIDRIIKKSNKDDLILVFYAGASTKAPDHKVEKLILPTYDTQLKNPLDNLTLNDIVDQMGAAVQPHRLLLIDGCHGTFGLTKSLSTRPVDQNDGTFQIIAASQDDQFAFESREAGGGVFTQKIVAQLAALRGVGARISARELTAAITPDLARLSNGGQSPKLVTLAGSHDVVLTRD